MKYLIINADDFGMSKEVNEGIKRGIEIGVINSVSVMVNMPYFDDAITFLRSHPEVSVGLHFNITEGMPLMEPNSLGSMLREDNSFYHWSIVAARLLMGKYDTTAVDRELHAQYTKLKSTNLHITHIDSHHHIHLYPAIFKKMIALANKEKIRTLRCRKFNIWSFTHGIKKMPGVKQLIIVSLCFVNNLHSRDSTYLYDVNSLYDVNWSDNYELNHFLRILSGLPDGITEIICHPAVMSETGNRTFLEPRQKTLTLLLKPEVRKCIKTQGILLKHRDELKTSTYPRMAYSSKN